MRFTPLFSLAATLVLPAMLPAQTRYFYSPNSSPTGYICNIAPFRKDVCRHHSLVRKTFLPSKSGVLQSVGFSPCQSSTLRFKALVINVGHNTSGVLGGTFAGNFTGPTLCVFNQAGFSWPVTKDTWSRIPFSRPFVYNGSDNLVVELYVVGGDVNSGSSFWRCQTEQRCYKAGIPPIPEIKTFGQGCRGSNNKVPAMEPLSYPMLGLLPATVFEVAVADGVANVPCALFLGTSRSTFAGLTLPFSLGFLGAPGCDLNSSIQAFMVATTSGQGTGTVKMGIPSDPALEGATLYMQWALYDKGANPAGLTTTAGLVVTPGSIGPATGNVASALIIEIGIL